MKRTHLIPLLALVASVGVVFLSFRAISEDIDLFSINTANTVDKPNVLFVLDNSANWSRQSQDWPGGLTQGQSEVRAIKTVINELEDNSVNVGLLEYSTEGSSGQNDGGYVRYHIRPMNSSNKAGFSTHLDTIFNNINDPVEKRSTGNPFGTLFWDVYNYLAGIDQSMGGAGTPSSRADVAAYQAAYSRFRSPLTSADNCTRTIVIFLGNNVSSGPTSDGNTNVQALAGLPESDTSQIPFANYSVQTTARTLPLGYTGACYGSSSACDSAVNTQSCRDDGFTSCTCDTTDTTPCSASHFSVVGVNSSSTTQVVSDTTDGPTEEKYTGENRLACKTAGQVPGYSCPATSTQTVTTGDQTTTTTTSWNSCAYASTGNSGCTGVKNNYEPRGTRTVRTVVTSTSTTTTRTALGETSACYTDSASCSTTGFSCSGYNGGCACDTATTTTGCGAGSSNQYQILGHYNETSATPTGTFSIPPTQGGGNFMADEWAKYLRQIGVPLPDTEPDAEPINVQVTTYTVDVFNKQQHADFSALLFNMARVGGGKYFQAKNEDAIVDALRQIFTEVQAVNSAFASASLPVNATNRSQNENQVYIGVFKPDRTKHPRWFGNLKRYQLIITSGGTIDLGDANGDSAINLQTGFISECAASFWTTDSGNYWSDVTTDDPAARGTCSASSADPDSDLPDGPFVEKGGVAEVLRKGNDPTATADGDGNYVLNRTVLTLSGNNLVDFDTSVYADSSIVDTTDANGNTVTAAAQRQTIVNFIRGQDPFDEDGDGSTTRGLTEARASIHGDVVHSRPQPINYAGTTGVVVYYGANDGTYRAVQASTGKELWSFVAPEHFSKLRRLRENEPLIKYFGDSAPSTAKDYFFDGSTGVFQNRDNSSITIFPSMRRGGRRLYAFDVTDPTDPEFLWRKGCPNLSNDTGCDTGFAEMGQTWAVPSVAFIKGYESGEDAVVVVGGGYDACEDADVVSPSCGSAKGSGVFVLRASDGALVKHFDFNARSVAADVALIDIDFDGFVDYAYAADTGGNIYRMDFIDSPTTKNALDSGSWTSTRIGYTNGGNRKFLFPPALLQNGTTVYLAIGSGDREHPLMANAAAGVINRFYVFKDNLAADPVVAVNLDDPTTMFDYTSETNCATEKVLPSTEEKGWFVTLAMREQVVTSAVIAGGFAIFSTNLPTLDDDTLCTTSLGEARGYFLNLLNASGGVGTTESCGGDRFGTFVGGGLPPSPVLATVPIDGEQKTVVIGAVQRSGGESASVGAQLVRPPIQSQRRPVYWYKSGDTQ